MEIPEWIYNSSRLIRSMEEDFEYISRDTFPDIFFKEDTIIRNKNDFTIMLENILYFDVRPIPNELYIYILRNNNVGNLLRSIKQKYPIETHNFFDFLLNIHNKNRLYEHLIENEDLVDRSLFVQINENILEWDETVCTYLVKTHHIALLKWMHTMGCPWDATTFNAAIDDLDLLIWLHVMRCPWDEDTAYIAINSGNIDVVLWLYENEYGLDDYRVIEIATKEGYLQILQWLYDHGYTIDRDIGDIAAKNNQFDVLKWLQTIRYYEFNESIFDYATESGNIELLEWLRDLGLRVYYSASYAPAGNGNLEVLEWLQAQNFPEYYINEDTCAMAAKNGHIDVLRWLHEHGCPWDHSTCNRAAQNGHLDCLTYAHENGCPWNYITCGVAAGNGNLDCLEYAHEHGCPWNQNTCIAAAQNGHVDCLEYIINNGCPCDIEMLYVYAMNAEQKEILRFLLINYKTRDKDKLFYIRTKYPELARYI